MRIQYLLSALPFFTAKEQPKRIVISNDDGWAVAQIRAQYDSLRDSGHDVILSAPAINQSGKGSRSKTPKPLTIPCEFDSCPTGSPAYGSNETDPELNYVNGYPVDAARYGIQNLAPNFWNSPPDLLVSGPNVGHNLGVQVFFSGTIGAACEASKQGIPALAFSGKSTSQVSYTTLTTDPSSPATLAAQTYASLTTHFINSFLSSPSFPTLLPPQTILSINYPPLSTRPNCSHPSDITFILTRAFPTIYKDDVQVCGNGGRLPVENEVVWDEGGCWASVSVLSARSKLDAGREVQEGVWNGLQGLGWGCFGG